MSIFFKFNRRHFLTNGSKILSIPFLPSLGFTRTALSQESKDSRQRLAIFYFPNGVPQEYWIPIPGNDGQWQLSTILQPLAPFKDRLNVYRHLENYSAAGDTKATEPSHSRLAGAFLTFNSADKLRAEKGLGENDLYNSISVDQILAKHWHGKTSFDSLQTGLSTGYYFSDYRHASLSRSISWASEKKPLYKMISPRDVYNKIYGKQDLVGVRSSIDFVAKEVKSLEKNMGSEDKAILGHYLDSLRSIEKNISNLSIDQSICPTVEQNDEHYTVGTSLQGYDRGKHGRLMNDLLVLAFQCDQTRILTHMLDDSRSSFSYDYLETKNFTKNSLYIEGERVANYHAAQHDVDRVNQYATISHEMMANVADFCSKLKGVKTPTGSNLLDETLVISGSDMQDDNHKGFDIPLLSIGNVNGKLKTNQIVSFNPYPDDRPLRDLYYTILKHGFGFDPGELGKNYLGKPQAEITEIVV